MSAPIQFRSLAFGDVDGTLWGAAVDLDSPALALGAGPTTTALAGRRALRWASDGPVWTLEADGVALTVRAGGEELASPSPSPSPTPATEMTGLEELCHVNGTVKLDGAEHEVSCVGTRCVVDRIDPAVVASLRAVSGWFGQEEAFALLSFRAGRGQGHESDLVAASLFDPDGWLAVSDPRMSTTYSASGEPLRTNLELWVGDGDNEYPRRTVGEVSGTRAVARAEGLELQASPLRCHSRGLDGSGVYVLATFQ